jgi:hypothetical protein
MSLVRPRSTTTSAAPRRDFLAFGVAAFGSLLARRVVAAGEERRMSTPSGSPRDSYRAGQRAKRSDERKKLFQEGITRAKAILAQRPEDPEGLFWLAVNLGAEALERGKLQALPVLPEMERLLLACHKAAPQYEHAGAARVLGRLYDKAPSVISIGSSAKARTWLERALALAPDFPGNLAFAADYLVRNDEETRAGQLARRCLQVLAKGGDFGPEADEWKTLAREVVEETS